MVRQNRKVIRKKRSPKETQDVAPRGDTPVGFRLNPDELRRVGEHITRAGKASGIEVKLGNFAKAATLAYGDYRAKLSEIELEIRRELAELHVAGAVVEEGSILDRLSKMLEIA